MIIKVGITGTRDGMSAYQWQQVIAFLSRDTCRRELHHGDCVGVDAEIAILARDLGWYIVCHPHIDEKLRAFTPYDETRIPKTHFARNRNIVDETMMMLVVPKQMGHQTFGGTWYTHDYAKKEKQTNNCGMAGGKE